MWGCYQISINHIKSCFYGKHAIKKLFWIICALSTWNRTCIFGFDEIFSLLKLSHFLLVFFVSWIYLLANFYSCKRSSQLTKNLFSLFSVSPELIKKGSRCLYALLEKKNFFSEKFKKNPNPKFKFVRKIICLLHKLSFKNYMFS